MGGVKRRVVAILGWLAAASLAVVVGLIAISLLRSDLGDSSQAALSEQEVTRMVRTGEATASSTGPPPTIRPTAAPRPSPTARATMTTPPGSRPTTVQPAPTTSRPAPTRTFTSRGGTVVARCQGRRAYLQSWSPAAGWSVDDVLRGPADSALLQFEGDNDDVDDLAVTITVTCRSGSPVGSVIVTDD